MSLDVYLTLPGANIPVRGSGIFVREGGRTVEISQEEWNERYPDREPVVLIPGEDETTDEVFTWNITHNLTKMADAAGLYYALWQPNEQFGITKAGQLIPHLEEGLLELVRNPNKYIAYNPENGWGNYEGLVEFVTQYLIACNKWPEADVKTWR